MKLLHPASTFAIPDGAGETAALGRVTHLGIGAHPDDLEFMALHGILACYEKSDAWFGGVTCTNGGPSLFAERHAEQEHAARTGEYSFIAQLGYSSAEAKDPRDDRLTRDLVTILSACRPHILYTHNPADKHDTHIAVLARVVKALRSLPPAHRPQRLLGCEVWRDLDWLDDAAKVRLDVSSHPDLAEKLAASFASQNAKKRYDLAVRGRELANATFYESHEPDGPTRVWHAMDLTPLLHDDTLTIEELTRGHLDAFANDVMEKISRYE
jgi:LmbE family N-acetylglucosaminyl deacetylase